MLPEKPTSHGDTATQMPTMRLSHSSHSANAASAAMAKPTTTMPLSQAFQLAVVSEANPKIHGDRNSHPPSTRLTTSGSASFFQVCCILFTSSLSRVLDLV